MQRIKINSSLTMSRLVYGMWRLSDDENTSPNHVRNKIASVTGFDTKNIVMSIGIDEKNSGKFSYLPLNEVSGNSIIIKSKYTTKYIINSGISIVPLDEDHLHVGSTYYNGNEDKGIDDLLKKTLKVIKKKYNLIYKKFGIRPASKDRRPMIGMSKKYL